MNRTLVFELMNKDLQEIRKNGYVLYSMMFLPLILTIIGIAATVGYTFTIGPNGPSGDNISTIFSSMFVLVPAIITTLIGSTSVIIEKNNRSLEPLLATPITDTELFAGKALAPLVPGVLISLFTYGIYIAATDALTFGKLGYLLYPTPLNIVQMFFLIPVIGMLGTFASLIVSSKTRDIRAAQQLSSLVVLPVLILVYVPLFAAGVDLIINLALGVLLLIVALVLFAICVKAFNRENILVNWE